MRHRRYLLAASLVLLASCGDSNSPAAVTGTASFSFTGAGGGSFSATGTMPTISANLGNSDWAAGHKNTASSGFEVAAARARGSGRYDLVALFIQRLTVGSATIDANCNSDTTDCTGLAFFRNISEADNTFDFFCVAATGSLAITEITDARIKGSFTGSGSCFNGSFAESEFSVTGGSFDVPLVPDLPQ